MKTSRLAAKASFRGLPHRRSAAPSHPSGSVRSIPSGRYLKIVALAGSLAALGHAANAASITLAWNANPESNITGYRLSYGTSPGSRPNSVNTVRTTQATVSGLAEGSTYYFAVQAIDQNGLQSAPSAEISHQLPASPGLPVTSLIPQSGWTLKSASSQETEDEDGRAVNAFDGNPATIWHSRFFTNSAPPPHEIQIDIGTTRSIAGFRYLPRQDAYNHGNIGQYEFYISTDGVNWGNAVAAGTFANTKAEKEVRFSAKSGRYIRLRALTDLNGGTVCSMAELNLIQGTETTEPPPQPANQAPLANNQNVTTAEDRAQQLQLVASDPDGDALTYRVVTTPRLGRLSGTPPNLTYTPNADANGGDTFTYQASDGALDSNTASVTITITPVNDPPVAQGLSVTTPADKATAVLLAASDRDGDRLSYRIVSNPAKGTLGGTAPNLTYTPKPEATAGSDSFSFAANDGTADSNIATVSITLIQAEKTNRPPSYSSSQIRMAMARVKQPYEGQSMAGTATDPDGQVVTYARLSGPEWLEISANGALAGTPPEEAAGLNQFQVRASDSDGASADATLLIEVRGALPLPWSLARIGNVDEVSDAAESSGAFEFRSNGSLRGSSDSGLFAWQTLIGDGSVVARLSALRDGDSDACAGLMVRESLAANSRHVFIGSDGQGHFRWIRRAKTGALSSIYRAGSGTPPDLWLRVSRSGGYLFAHTSTNGSNWKLVARTGVSLGSSCYIGLITGGGASAMGSAVFENVGLNP